MIIPAQRLFIVLAAIAFMALGVSIWPAVEIFWLSALLILGIFALIDAFFVYRPHGLRVQRDIAASLPLGVDRVVKLRVYNDSQRNYQLHLFDHYPLDVNVTGLPIKLGLAANTHADLRYKVHAVKRGKIHFSHTQIHLLSPLGFWQRNCNIDAPSEVHIYPNFAAVSHYALMATDNRLSQMGIVKKRRRGEGQDFHQLREYQQGDSMRQIDWKASSRMRKVISREYQDERDQEIIFLLDCGHRMQAQDNELSHFDHTLNAILLLSYVALKQGDSVGLATFSGVSRWTPPRKGQHIMQQILNTIYDLQPTTESPDYSQIATELMVRHKKRALVVLITNLRDEDADDLLPALKLLRKRHLVLLASMREQALDDVLENPVTNYDEAIVNSATQHYLQYRKKTFDTLKQAKVISLDVPPQALSVNLINHYLDIKGSGML